MADILTKDDYSEVVTSVTDQNQSSSTPDFGGVIGKTLADSTPWFPPPAPAIGQPNVVMVVLDDTGFGHLGCFGSSMRTPHIDALANEGLRYTNFHTTSLCSPTRACLMTGHNHHSVGMRGISNWNSGFPHMTGRIPTTTPTIAERLRTHGYATYAAGKWHLAPMEDSSAGGPHDQWPLQRGFDKYYGFLQGETDQFSPELTRDNHHIDPPATADDGYHVSEDIVDESIRWIHDLHSTRRERPFFLYLAFGAMHAPHHAPKAYLDQWRGAFDDGYDVTREQWFATQQALGVIPENTTLCPPNPGVPSWGDLSTSQQRFAARLQEAFAAMLEHTDAQIGRLMDELDRLQCLDDTVVVLLSDNGASQEGGAYGVLNEWSFFNGVDEHIDDLTDEELDEIGGPASYSNIPWGWAQAGNAPLRWYKQNTYGGGLRTPLIIRSPQLIDRGESGAIRTQFCHAIDVAATVLDVAGCSADDLTGVTIQPTFNDPDSGPVRTTQYFEQLGHRGIFHDGWKATTYHHQGTPFDEDVWELFDLSTDFSETHDLSGEHPERLAELTALWWDEAHRHGVLPLDDRTLELFLMEPRSTSPHATGKYRYLPPVSQIPADACPRLGGNSFVMSAAIHMDDSSEQPEGIIFARGSQSLGQCLWLDSGQLRFSYHAFDERLMLHGQVRLQPGLNRLEIRFEKAGTGTTPADVGAGMFQLVHNDQVLDHVPLKRVVLLFGAVGMRIGRGPFTPIVAGLAGPTPFTGDLREFTVTRLSSGLSQYGDEQLTTEPLTNVSPADVRRYGSADLSRE